MNRLLRLRESVKYWKAKKLSNIEDWQERNAALRDQKEVMAKHYNKLKKRMDQMRRQQQRRLKELSKHSGAAADSLKERIALAERILRLSEFCRALETEQEKVLPFWSPAEALADEILEGDLAADLAEAQHEASAALREGEGSAAVAPKGEPAQVHSRGIGADGRPVPPHESLNNFFKKYNKLTLDVASIRRERGRLNEEVRRRLSRRGQG